MEVKSWGLNVVLGLGSQDLLLFLFKVVDLQLDDGGVDVGDGGELLLGFLFHVFGNYDRGEGVVSLHVGGVYFGHGFLVLVYVLLADFAGLGVVLVVSGYGLFKWLRHTFVAVSLD